MMMEFVAWPKIPRITAESVVITEKIDGTNAQVVVTPTGEVYAGSRTRWITPADDNYGFAAWVEGNKEELRKLGHGRHFGEWWGRGIQRGYGLNERRFSLFNVRRPRESLPAGVSLVPVLYSGTPGTEEAKAVVDYLRTGGGSIAAPGFMNPEGVVHFYTASGSMLKEIFDTSKPRKGS